MSDDKTGYDIVIPARFASSRFPGKPLHPINGVPMILHTVARACESNASKVVVATDDERIADVCIRENIDVAMTRAEHASGTDRIAEVADARGWPAERIIVGLQGDEPATPADHLDFLADNLGRHADADMATLCTPIARQADYLNPNRVKVVRDHRGMAMYFSRAPLPHRRDQQVGEQFPASSLHIGLYAYRCAFLAQYSALCSTVLEHEEQLEQLRVLYHGGRIHVAEVAATESVGVDHPDDVATIERLLSCRELRHES